MKWEFEGHEKIQRMFYAARGHSGIGEDRAKRDVRILQAWNCRNISTRDAIDLIRENNDSDILFRDTKHGRKYDFDLFGLWACSLGYYRMFIPKHVLNSTEYWEEKYRDIKYEVKKDEQPE